MFEMLELGSLPKPDEASGRSVAERAVQVLRPHGALARLDELAVWLAEWQRTSRPAVERPGAIIVVSDHGVAAEGISAYPASVTRSMLEALESGAATAAVMAKQLGVDLRVVDVGVGEPTGNIRFEPAMSHEEFAEAVQAGTDAVAGIDADLLVLGEMGIGNTTSAAAVSAALFRSSAKDWVGPGTGLDDRGVAHKIAVVADSVARVGDVSPLEALRQLGGKEMAALAGAALEARRRSLPVLLDGYVVTASVMPLEMEHRGALDHCWPAHISPEPGHRRLLADLNRPPILDLNMRLGEGSGALAALPLVRLAAASVVEVATFSEWGL